MSVQIEIDTVCLAYIFEESILAFYFKKKFIPMSIFIISFLNLETTCIYSLHMQSQRATRVSCSKPEYTSTAARSYSVQTIFDLSVSPLLTKNRLSFVGEEVCHQMQGWHLGGSVLPLKLFALPAKSPNPYTLFNQFAKERAWQGCLL